MPRDALAIREYPFCGYAVREYPFGEYAVRGCEQNSGASLQSLSQLVSLENKEGEDKWQH